MRGWFAAFFVFASSALAQPETARDIMAKVADNQDRAQQMRSAFIYHQSILLRFKRGNGRLAREEQREYTVTPTTKGSNKDLVHFAGKYESHGTFFDYDKPGYQYKDVDIDGELADDFVHDFANDEGARDGIGGDLFPLTSKEQKKYTFRLDGKEDFRGTEVYRITFKPARSSGDNNDGTCWAGEALIDIHAYQPVLITTWLAKGVPIAVQILLGTNLKHLGFKVSYKKFDEGLWFPVSYGGEFQVRAVFLYKRTIAMSVTNSGFQKADVTSTVSFQPPVIP